MGPAPYGTEQTDRKLIIEVIFLNEFLEVLTLVF